MGAILCYHGVTAASWPSESTANVPASELESAIQLVQRLGEIVPLTELVDRHRAGRSTSRLVALTFDDAYVTLPLLFRSTVPITVFVTTDATDTGARFWWDRIDDLFVRVPAARWRAFEDTIGLPAAFRAGQPPELGPLRPLRQWILAEHRGRWPDHLEAPLAALEREHGHTTVQRAMTWEEMARFARADAVDVGVHTISHPVLPLLDASAFEHEVAGAFQRLRERIPKAVPILAIPFGLYDAETEARARRAGMRTSLTLANRSLRGVRPDAALPRLSMGRGLRRWQLALRLAVPRSPPRRYPALPSATS